MSQQETLLKLQNIYGAARSAPLNADAHAQLQTMVQEVAKVIQEHVPEGGQDDSEGTTSADAA